MEIRGITQAELATGKLDVTKMGPAELAFRQAMLAKKAAKKGKKR